ncbi:MAG: hypothetical protein E6987_02140 [Peptoniphilus harei]|nr:hypothetical protein [Peptoniphilus harei]
MSISKNIESSFDFLDIESPRIASINFYQRIIEDLTGNDVMGIGYNNEEEIFTVVFINPSLPKLFIDVRWDDSLQACTGNIIEQTQAWIEEQRKEKKL